MIQSINRAEQDEQPAHGNQHNAGLAIARQDEAPDENTCGEDDGQRRQAVAELHGRYMPHEQLPVAVFIAGKQADAVVDPDADDRKDGEPRRDEQPDAPRPQNRAVMMKLVWRTGNTAGRSFELLQTPREHAEADQTTQPG